MTHDKLTVALKRTDYQRLVLIRSRIEQDKILRAKSDTAKQALVRCSSYATCEQMRRIGSYGWQSKYPTPFWWDTTSQLKKPLFRRIVEYIRG